MTRVSAGVVALLVATSAAHAQPTAVPVSRNAKFVRATCDWLGRDLEITERQLAEHIGRITKMEQNSLTRAEESKLFTVSSSQFPNWVLIVRRYRSVEIKIPPEVQLTVGQLERYWGKAEQAVADRRISVDANSSSDSGSEPIREMLDFARMGKQKICPVSVMVSTRSKNRSASTADPKSVGS